MCGSVGLAVKELKEHGVGDVQSRQLLERRGWHNDLSAIVEIFSFWAGEHDGGVAAVVFIEAFGSSSPEHVLVHGQRILVLVIAVVRRSCQCLFSEKRWGYLPSCSRERARTSRKCFGLFGAGPGYVSRCQKRSSELAIDDVAAVPG